MSTEKNKQPLTFRRGLFAAIIGLLHVSAGFLGTAWAAWRIIIVGYKEAFSFGAAIGVFNYAFEASSLLLWISGIGILRGKSWGRILAAVWAFVTILFRFIDLGIQKYYWGILSSGFGWGDILILYYSGLIFSVVAGTWIFRRAYNVIVDRILYVQWPFCGRSYLYSYLSAVCRGKV